VGKEKYCIAENCRCFEYYIWGFIFCEVTN
jgi:hypothetical protein